MRGILIGSVVLLVMSARPAGAASIVIGGTAVDDQGQFSAVAGVTTVDFNAVPAGNQVFTTGLATYHANIFSCACTGDGDLRDDTTRGARALVGTPLTIDFSRPVSAFGLYWGSPDRGNTLTFFDGAAQVFSVTGADLNRLGVGFGLANAAYVNVSAGVGERFTRIVLSSSDFPFETDNHAYAEPVPEPAALLLLAAGALGLMPRSGRLVRPRRRAGC